MTNNATSKEKYNILVDDIKNHVLVSLNEQMSEMLNSSDQELFDMADNASNNQEQRRCFELMKQLQNIRNSLTAEFIDCLEKSLCSYTESTSQDTPVDNFHDQELSLVDPKEMEDMVLIKSISDTASAKYREKLTHLTLRLESLAIKTPKVFEKNALSPTSICKAYNDTLGDVFELHAKKLLFRFFEKHIIYHLGPLYDDVNGALIDAGILPEINIAKVQSHGGRKLRRLPSTNQQQNSETDTGEDYPDHSGSGMAGDAMSQNHQPNQGGSPLDVDNYMDSGALNSPPPGPMNNESLQASAGSLSQGSYENPATPGPQGQNNFSSASPTPASHAPQTHGGYAMTAPPGNTQHHTGNDNSGGGYNEQAANNQSGGYNGQGGSANAANSQPYTGSGNSGRAEGGTSNYQHQTAGMPASQVDHVLTGYFGAPISSGTPTSSDKASVAYQTAGSAQYLGHSEILTALSNVQQNEEFNNPTELKTNTNAIKQAVISTIAKQSGGAVTKRINQIAEKTIDFIEMIFDAIIDDDSISDTIKALLLRLQIPVIKASMLDQEFFIYDNHPARVLLDKITELGIGVVQRDDEVYITLDKLVNKLVTDYDLQTSTFENALEELNKYIEQREQAACEKEAEAQKQVIKDHARNTVLKTLRSVTKGKQLPESVHALILRRWPTLMFNHYVEKGKENDEWVRIVEILRDLIESIQPLETAADLARMKATRLKLTETARVYLSRTNQSKRDLQEIIADLESTYDSMEERADFAPEQVQTASEAIEKEDVNVKVELPKVEEEPKQALPPNVMPGMWFKVHVDDDSRPRRCKLSVILMEDSKLVFVNYSGEVIVEKSFDGFTKELATNESQVIMGHSVFDHALNSAITSIGSKH